MGSHKTFAALCAIDRFGIGPDFAPIRNLRLYPVAAFELLLRQCGELINGLTFIRVIAVL